MDQSTLKTILNRDPVSAPSPSAKERAVREGVRAFSEARDAAVNGQITTVRPAGRPSAWDWLMGYRAPLFATTAACALVLVTGALIAPDVQRRETNTELLLADAEEAAVRGQTVVASAASDKATKADAKNAPWAEAATPVEEQEARQANVQKRQAEAQRALQPNPSDESARRLRDLAAAAAAAADPRISGPKPKESSQAKARARIATEVAKAAGELGPTASGYVAPTRAVRNPNAPTDGAGAGNPTPVSPDMAAAVAQARADGRKEMSIAAASPPSTAQSAAQGNYADALRAQADRAHTIAPPQPMPPVVEGGRERFEQTAESPVKAVSEHPVSTFSIDVDTASYAFVRRSLMGGQMPPPGAVRVEEMINYFAYDYPGPASAEMPFRANLAVYPTPWNAHTKLLHIGLKGYDIVPDEKPRSNLVFLIDVSGSMSSADKLPLLKAAYKLLVQRLEPEDTVSIVTYAGRAGTVLEPTRVGDRRKILAAIDRLRSGGSTAGAQGIQQAYALAEQAFDPEGVNRVILATDGDFNVGITDTGALKRYIEQKRRSGIFLSVLGFGRGNYNDALMQALAQNGNGNAAYIDSLREAQKVLVEEAGSTLFPIAKDVKIQIEFNPAVVSEYRLIGYETRRLNRADFNNDKVDAGDIGSGHTVTAIYEITPVDSPQRLVEGLRYRREAALPTSGNGDEYAFLKLRYKRPQASVSKLLTVPVTRALDHASAEALPADLRFAAAVAAFGQKLAGSTHLADTRYDAILALAMAGRGPDPYGYRAEFLNLVRVAAAIAGESPAERQ